MNPTAQNDLINQFLQALSANVPATLKAILDEDATLRIYGYQGLEINRPQNRVIERLTAESAQWPDATLEIFTLQTTNNKTAVEFRIQATENGRYGFKEYAKSYIYAWMPIMDMEIIKKLIPS